MGGVLPSAIEIPRDAPLRNKEQECACVLVTSTNSSACRCVSRSRNTFNLTANTVEQVETQETFAEQSLNSDVVPNSTVSVNATLDDTGTVLVTQPISSMVAVHYPLPDQTPSKMLSRLYELSGFTWATTTAPTVNTPYQVLDPMRELLQFDFIDCVCEKFYYIRADLEVHLRLNTNQFYAGALMVTACPDPSTPLNGGNQQARSWMGPKILSAQSQDTLILTLPWSWPARFRSVAEILEIDTPNMWNIYIDVLSQLRATLTASSSIDVSVFAKFVNPQVVFPYTVATPERQSASQASVMRPKVQPARPKQVQIAASNGAANPVQQAIDGPMTSFVSTAGTVMGALDSVVSAFGSLGSLAGLLDKPEKDNEVMRVHEMGGLNVCTVDRADQSLPLTLYHTSYMNVDATAVPGGGLFTPESFAQTPALHAMVSFVDATTTYTFPLMAAGTPFFQMSQLHRFYRGSVRMLLKFFAPSFVSARVLIVFYPESEAPDQSVSNNISKVVDVKGDTTDSMLIPYVWPYDFLDRDDEFVTGTLSVSILSQIVSNDAAASSQIDMVVFSAAGPDCQFSVPSKPPPPTYTYPNVAASVRVRPKKRDPGVERKAEKQCDIAAEFASPFKPLIQGISGLRDCHHTTSESTVHITDLMKRYQSATLGQFESPMPVMTLCGRYTPVAGTVGAYLAQCFLFARGGVRYKIVTKASSYVYQVYGTDSDIYDYELDGSPAIAWPSDSQTMDVTVPYYSTAPFIPMAGVAPAPLDPRPGFPNPMSFCVAFPAGGPTFATVYQYTAVRDDFVVGFMVAPDASYTHPRVEVPKGPQPKIDKSESLVRAHSGFARSMRSFVKL